AGADIAATLARHGVKTTLSTAQSLDKSASHFIENRLSDSSIDLLVMGAYTHSWLWQMIFFWRMASIIACTSAPAASIAACERTRT
ncbi:hypothetical protein ACC745_38660, partial [Rhizobium ruizarguesonis]